MYLHVDLSQVPPTVALREQDDFTSFRVVADAPAHAWVEPDALVGLAGDPGDTWVQQLADMVTYARTRGWVDGTGRIRAHLELATNADAAGT